MRMLGYETDYIVVEEAIGEWLKQAEYEDNEEDYE